jgi:tetratricopeptide (TPR) repeat protein
LDQPVPLTPERRATFEAAMKAQDYKRAEALLVEAINANPNSPQLLVLAAGVFFLDGDYMNTAIAYKKAEKLAPLDDTSRFTLAMAYIALGRREWARPELEKLAAANVKVALYPYWLASLDYDDQKFAAAAENLNRAVSLKPDFVKAHDNLGLNLEALGKFEEAQRAYGEAVRLNRVQKPSSPWPPLNLGVMLLKLGKLDLAEPYLREALELNPKFAEARYRLGILLEKKGKAPEAILELARAAELDAKYPDPLYALARLYRQAGEMEKAQAALAEFQKRKSWKRPSQTTKASMPTRAIPE